MAETIIKSKDGGVIKLTKTRLTQVSVPPDALSGPNAEEGLYYVLLKNLPLVPLNNYFDNEWSNNRRHVKGYSSIRVHLHNKAFGYAPHPKVSMVHSDYTIGCAEFSKADFEKIMEAAKAAQKDKKKSKKKRS